MIDSTHVCLQFDLVCEWYAGIKHAQSCGRQLLLLMLLLQKISFLSFVWIEIIRNDFVLSIYYASHVQCVCICPISYFLINIFLTNRTVETKRKNHIRFFLSVSLRSTETVRNNTKREKKKTPKIPSRVRSMWHLKFLPQAIVCV